MSAKGEFENFVAEQISAFGPITQKRMFGALAFYHQGLIIGMAIDDALFLKADDQSKSRFESEGLPQFTYGHKSGKQIGMAYWRAPERCLDDPDEMKAWCKLAYQAALRAKKPEKNKSKRLKLSDRCVRFFACEYDAKHIILSPHDFSGLDCVVTRDQKTKFIWN